MRITIMDSSNMAYNVDSDNPEVLGKWFVDTARKIMSDSNVYNRMQIWPQNEQERQLCLKGWQGRIYPLTQDTVLEWAKLLTDFSAELGDIENEQDQISQSYSSP